MAFVLVLTLLLDQLSKAIASEVRGTFYIIPGVLRFVKAHNRGIAMGFFGDLSELIVWVIASVVLFLTLLPKIVRLNNLEKIAMGFILGGALGNLVDRLRFGYVLDFLNITFLPAVFNLADVFILIGGGLMVIGAARGKCEKELESRKERGRLEIGSVPQREDSSLDLEDDHTEGDKGRESAGQRTTEEAELQVEGRGFGRSRTPGETS